jgi:sugar phosphate permease
MCSGFAHLIMLYLPTYWGTSLFGEWNGDMSVIILTLSILSIIVLAYAVIRETPQSVNLPEYAEHDDAAASTERTLDDLPVKYFSVVGFFLKKKRVICWAAIAFLSSFCRYGILAWIPAFYGNEGALIVIDSRITNFWLSTGMAFGTFFIVWLADKKFTHNKGLVVATCAGLCATLIILFPSLTGGNTIISGIFSTGFLLFGINGVLWLAALDEGGRRYSGTMTGILNCAAYLGAAAQPSVFSFLLAKTTDRMFIFLMVEIICILMVTFALFVCKRDTHIVS